MFTVYKITCKNNGKSYVGFTKRKIEDRWKSHQSSARNGSNFRFHAAIRKHGVDAWVIEGLREFEHEADAREYEALVISESALTDLGYNAKPGGCGGWIVPDDKIGGWKEKLSAQNTGSGNGNFGGMSDRDIIDKFVLGERDRIYDPASGITSAIKACANEYGTPLSFTKNFRFVEYGGGANGLLVALRDRGICFSIRPFSDTRRVKISDSLKGRVWYTDTVTGATKQCMKSPGEGWVKGRKNDNNHK